jgi:hypothetical protein
VLNEQKINPIVVVETAEKYTTMMKSFWVLAPSILIGRQATRKENLDINRY